MQYVKVDLGGRAYTYSWDGQYDLEIGDVVEVPGNVVNPKPQEAPVIRLLDGPDFDGNIAEILGLVV